MGLQSALPDMARSVMEGVAYELRDCLEVHRDVLSTQNVEIEGIRISGGNVRNPLWLRILSDVLDAPLQVPRVTELGALGAAMNAAIGAGYYDTHDHAAEQMLAIDRELEPDPQNRAVYGDGYEQFRSAYRRSAIP